MRRITTKYWGVSEAYQPNGNSKGDFHVGVATRDFEFKVDLVAVVRVQAADESVARQVVPTVLGAPSTVEIGLANENNVRATGRDATVT